MQFRIDRDGPTLVSTCGEYKIRKYSRRGIYLFRRSGYSVERNAEGEPMAYHALADAIAVAQRDLAHRTPAQQTEMELWR